MTVIVGVEHGGRVYLAGDSCITWDGSDVRIQREPKVWRAGPVVLGAAGEVPAELRSWRPPRWPGRGLLGWARRVMAPALPRGGGEGYELLLGAGGQLLGWDGNGTVYDHADGFGAIGTGADVAMGALYATQGRPPRERLRLALEAAEAYAAGVRRPWRMVSG